MLSLPLCPTLCDPMDCSPPGSSVHGILQARILEWAAMPFSQDSHVIQQFWECTHEKWTRDASRYLYNAPTCMTASSQCRKGGNGPNAHGQLNGSTKWALALQWNVTQPWKARRFWHRLQPDEIWRHYANWQKLGTNGSTRMRLLVQLNLKTQSRIMVARVWREGWLGNYGLMSAAFQFCQMKNTSGDGW